MNSYNTAFETILIKSLKRNNCENILGRNGLIWKSILEAMAIASQSETRPETNSVKLYTEDITKNYDAKQQITQHNLNNIISDEFGKRVSNTYLNKILAISTSEDDFLNKVNFHITLYGTPVSEKNNDLIRKYYKENKSTETPQPTKQNYKTLGKTLKEITLDWVERNGPKTSTEIRKFMYEMTHPGQTYDPVENRGWYSSYFSDSCNAPAAFSYPSRNDIRILSKHSDGKWYVIYDHS